MSVDKNCTHDIIVIELNVSAGERLQHTVTSLGDVTWKLLQAGVTLLSGTNTSSESMPWTAPPNTTAKHSLAMQFVGRGEVVWTIRQLSAGGTIATLKHCTYTNDGGSDDHFDNVTIHTV